MNCKPVLCGFRAIRVQCVRTTLFCCALAISGTSVAADAQLTVISADNLTPFQPCDVGTTSAVKNVRIKLNYARALSSIAVAPGNSEFAMRDVSGCVVDGQTINPAMSVCSVEVTFSPKYPGLRSAPLIVTDNLGTKSSIGLLGTGQAPQAALTPGIIATVAGNGAGGFSGDGGPAADAMFNGPWWVVGDWEGNLYISDADNYRIRKIDSNGIISTVAGNGSANLYGFGGQATSAGIGSPSGLAVDAAGNLYFTNSTTTRVFKVNTNGILTVFAGNGSWGDSGDGGMATQAALKCPYGLAVDTGGNVYIADECSTRVRKVDPKGIITTFAGNGTSGGPLGDGGPATEATLGGPYDLAVDAAGNLYIDELWGNRIRKVDLNGTITTIAGIGSFGFSGDEGPATQAEFTNPHGVGVDAAGNVYVADSGNYRIRRIDTNGWIKTIAGTGSYNYNEIGDGGPATLADIMSSSGIAIDASGAIFLPDYDRIRKIDVSQSAVKFTFHIVGTVSPSHTVVVTNTGNQHLEITDLNFSGDYQQQTGAARDCTDTTFLGSGRSCALRIIFIPMFSGPRDGTLTVTDNSLNLPGTTQAISLSGTGVNP